MDMFAEPIPDLPGVPAELTALLRWGMANDPRARPTAAELRDELGGTRRDDDPTMIMRPLTIPAELPPLSPAAPRRPPAAESAPPPRLPMPRRPSTVDDTTEPGPGPDDPTMPGGGDPRHAATRPIDRNADWRTGR